jgi:hypothetical protein
MIDPFTAMATATAAFNGIKKAVSVGKEISSMGSTLSSWSKAVSDLDFLDEKAKKPPLYKKFTNTQSDALDIWTKKTETKRDEGRVTGVYIFCLWAFRMERNSSNRGRTA